MKDFILPDIGEGIVECELLEWLVKEGDHIVEDQPVAEVMTDKATVQIPSMHTGVVKTLYYQAGDIAKVNAPLFAMQIEGEAEISEKAEQVPPKPEDTPAARAPVAVLEDFILPDIGEGIVECEIVKWLVSEGEQVEEDQAVVEVMTDKAVVEIPAKHSGTVAKLYYQQGDIAKVHTPLFAMQVEGVQMQSVTAAPTQSPAAETRQPADPSPDAPRRGKALASPAVRRLAKEMEIDISQVPGSGKKGRVMKQDLQTFSAAPASDKAAPELTQPVRAVSTTRIEPLRGIKAAMAKQMTKAAFTIPHFTVSEEINMDRLIEVRADLKPGFEQQGLRLSFMPFFIKALSMALKSFPIINSQVNEACSEITYFDDHNVGMAVDAKVGLLVPNIKGVQHLSLLEIAREVNRLTDLAREGKLSGDDLSGGTVSISNVGVLGGTTATPVINHPESAIVALGKMQRLPRFDQHDQVRAVNIMHISWSGDHRIIDGATMVKFNNLWKSYLENPVSMLAELR